MNKTATWLVVIIVLLAVGLIGWAYVNSHKSASTDFTDQSLASIAPENSIAPTASPMVSETPSPSGSPAASTSPTVSASTVTITDTGFTPATLTVAAGTTVTFVNSGQGPHWPASNPHPIHTDLPGFDAKRGLATGESYSFTFTKVGSWGYHDHLNPSHRGTIVVQ